MEEREIEVKKYWNEVSDSEWYQSLRTEEKLDSIRKNPEAAFYPGLPALMEKHTGGIKGKRILYHTHTCII